MNCWCDLDRAIVPVLDRDVRGFYLEYDAFLSRLAPRITVLANVFLREFVDVCFGTLKCLCDDLAPN